MGRRVEEAEDRLHLGPRNALFAARIDFVEDAHPDLEVGPLQTTHRLGVARGEAGEVVVLDPDEVTVSQGEVGVERNERSKRIARRRGLSHVLATLVEESFTDVNQEFGQDRLLARKVAVERRPTDAGVGCEFFDGHRTKAPFREEP